jgi:hypothetical protein
MNPRIKLCPPDPIVRRLKRDRLLLIATCLVLLAVAFYTVHRCERLSANAYQVISRGQGDGL